MKVFVINLKASPERRQFMERQLAALDLPAEFFPAVDGRRLTEDEVGQQSNRVWFRRYVGREMTRADLGCSLSHILVYRKIIEENLPCALVLEDDAWLTPAIKPVMEALEEDIPRLPVDVVLFSQCSTVGARLWNIATYFLCPVVQAYFAHAYVVTPAGARRLQDALFPVCHQADAWDWLLKHRVVRVAAINKVLATQNQMVLASTNPGRQGVLPSRFSIPWWSRKMQRAFWRAYDLYMPLSWRRIKPSNKAARSQALA